MVRGTRGKATAMETFQDYQVKETEERNEVPWQLRGDLELFPFRGRNARGEVLVRVRVSDGGWLRPATVHGFPQAESWGEGEKTHPLPLLHNPGRTGGSALVDPRSHTHRHKNSKHTPRNAAGRPHRALRPPARQALCKHALASPARGTHAAARPGRPGACARPRRLSLRVPPAPPRSSGGEGGGGRGCAE